MSTLSKDDEKEEGAKNYIAAHVEKKIILLTQLYAQLRAMTPYATETGFIKNVCGALNSFNVLCAL